MTQTTNPSRSRPIVGVLLGNSIILTDGVRELVKANQQAKTTLYFFSTKDVDYDQNVITGTYYDTANHRFGKKEFPFPDVVYVRGGSGNSVTAMIKKFDEMGIIRINPIIAFNKSELYHKLSEDSRVRPFLPFTKDVTDTSEIRDILKERNSVYIKACRGRRGTKVMRVVKLPGGRYEYSYSVIKKLVRNQVRSSESLQKAIDSFFGDREVIAQQAIDLLTVSQTRPVDCRAEVQRNKNGEIEIVAIPIRVGRSNSPITTHASAYRFEDYLKKLFPKYSKREILALENRVNDFLKTVYRSVEKVYGNFGEIGIDFAVDKKGKIWLIECNAQSAKVSIRKSYGKDTVRKIYANPLEYAKVLARSGSVADRRKRW